VLLVPGRVREFDAAGADLDVLHMVVPKPPAAVEDGLPGGPGLLLQSQDAARP
jgi:hypothetical protein